MFGWVQLHHNHHIVTIIRNKEFFLTGYTTIRMNENYFRENIFLSIK